MSTRSRATRALSAIAALAIALAACSPAPATTTSPPASVAPTTLASAPPAATASASTAVIPDGTYAAAPMDVAAIKALVNADTKLTAAEKKDIIENSFDLGSHKTVTVTLEFQAGQWTQHQGFDGAMGGIGSRATYAFPDDHTLVIEESCCGISTLDVTPAQNGFSLKVRSGAFVSTEVDTIVTHILFESSPFTRVP
jgi:hypothetical protein